MRGVWCTGALSLFLVAGTLSGPSALALQDDLAVVVLKDGTEISGQIVEESDDAVRIKTDFGVTKIKRNRIKEIQRGKSPFKAEFKRRFERASEAGKVDGLLDLASWARDKGLEAEARRAFEKVVEIDVENSGARKALGHARLEGKWVDEKKVLELTSQGWVVRGVDLVKGEGGTAEPKTVVKKRPKRELSDKEKAAEEKRQRRRKKDLEEFQDTRRREQRGVPWEDAWRINTPNYVVICNSTEKVAKTYGGIMEEIHKALRRWVKMPFLRKGRPAVFIYKSQEEFMERTRMPQGVGGYYQPANEQVHAYHGGFGTTGSTLVVLAHEATHQFQGKVLGASGMRNFPKWVIEGMAVYLGDGSRLNYKKRRLETNLIPRDRLYHIQRKMKTKTHTPVDKLCVLGGPRFTGSHYADSWALLYYLFEGPKKSKGRNFFVEYWMRGLKKQLNKGDFSSLASKYFGSMDKLETDWQKFILSLEPEQAGSVDDDVFVSDKFMFEVRLPWEKWEWVFKGENSSVLVGMKVPDTQVKATVRFFNNNDKLGPDEAFEKLKERELKDCTDFKTEKASVSEASAIAVTYADRGYGDDDEDDKKDKKADEKKEKKADEELADSVRKKYKSFVVVSLNNMYLITGEAPYDEFDQWEEDFDDIAESFELILKVRW